MTRLWIIAAALSAGLLVVGCGETPESGSNLKPATPTLGDASSDPSALEVPEQKEPAVNETPAAEAEQPSAPETKSEETPQAKPADTSEPQASQPEEPAKPAEAPAETSTPPATFEAPKDPGPPPLPEGP